MKQRFFCLIFLLFATTLVSQAQQDPRKATYLAAKGTMNYTELHKYLDQLFPEWQLSKMMNLCTIISGRMKDNNPESGYKYLYQRRIYEAARVDKSTDSKEVIAKKIVNMWTVYEQLNLLKCNSTQFDVMDGSLLKYAVSYKFTEFIDEAIRWKVPLNKIDYTDNRTLLDYVQYHINRNKGNALEELFQIYYEKLRSAGAKHKTELLSDGK
jgi:hypothetical protein